MAYKVRASRNEDGSYALSYGKGGKKLEAQLNLVKSEATGMDRWMMTMNGSNGQQHKLKRQAIAEWETWAIENYGGEAEEGEVEPALCVLPAGELAELEEELEEKSDLPFDAEAYAPPVQYDKRFGVYPQRANQVYTYTRGFAIFDHLIRSQVGWCLSEARANEAAAEHNAEVSNAMPSRS